MGRLGRVNPPRLPSHPPDGLRVVECLAHVFDGVLAPFPGHVQKTFPMKLKAEVGTARVAWLEAVLWHHREPDSEAFEFVGLKFLEQLSDNSLSVDAHRSRG